MMGKIEKIIIALIMVVILIPNTALANMMNPEIREMDLREEVIDKYLYLDASGNVVYERDKAVKDNVDQLTLEVADFVYNFMAQQINSDGAVPFISVPVYGNWCGPEYGQGSPIDLLDECCRRHDVCYGEIGYHKCSCDRKLVADIDKYIDRMSGKQYVAALGVRKWMNYKATHVDPDGKGGLVSCVL